jgi:membrane protein YdbS with pleckstrin-like domain
MDRNAIRIHKTPFLFLKWLVVIEFFFALLPFLVVLLLNLRQSYEGTGLSGTLSYNLLLTIVMTTIQVLIIAISFVAWYFPVYQVDRRQILLRRSNLFEDRKVVDTQAIAQIEVKQGRLARRLDYGTLAITSGDAAGKAYVKSIPNPASYAELIRGLVEKEEVAQLPEAPESIGELIGRGENQYAEFKSSLTWDYRQQRVNKALYEPVMKNVVGFLNSTGGAVLIGVDDDGQVLGLEADYRTMRKPNADGFENVFNMAFNKMIGVEYRRFVDVTFPQIDGKEICVASVRPSTQPAYMHAKGTETFYLRAGNASLPLTVSQAARYIREHFKD